MGVENLFRFCSILEDCLLKNNEVLSDVDVNCFIEASKNLSETEKDERVKIKLDEYKTSVLQSLKSYFDAKDLGVDIYLMTKQELLSINQLCKGTAKMYNAFLK